jgi:hypothetical protein
MWLQGLGCGAAVAMAGPSTAAAAILLAPGLLAAVLEGGSSQPSARAALLCGAAGAAATVVAVWHTGQDVAGAITMAADPAVLATCWAAQAAGWLLAQIAPVVVRLTLDAAAATRAALLRAERARHEAAWGIAPAGGEAPEV